MYEEFNPVVVYTADQRAPLAEAALVLAAVGIEHRVEQTATQWHLLVDEGDMATAHTQLHHFWAENARIEQAPVKPTMVDNGWYGVLGYLAVIWFIPATTGFSAVDFKMAGNLHALAVSQGEWWRVITALTLHADLAHIASNSLFGTIFGLFVGRYLGSGLGWLLVLICGALANLLNAFIQPDVFRSIGASTATFAALGLVPAFAWRRGYFRGRGWKRGFAPIFAAIALLAFTGMGGGAVNVDVLGHVFGFCAGLSAGLIFAKLDLAAVSQADQQRAGAFAIVSIAAAWLFALN